MTWDELSAAPAAGERNYLSMYRRSFAADRSPDVMVRPKEYNLMMWRACGTSHGTPYRFDTHVPMLFFGAGIAAGDIEAVGMPPRGRDLGRHRLFEGEPHRIRQRLHRRRRAVHVRGRLLCIAERALRPEIDADAAVEPLVVGRRQGGEHHQAEIDAGMGIPLVGVDEIGDLRRAIDGDMAGVAGDRHRRLDLEIAKAMAGHGADYEL